MILLHLLHLLNLSHLTLNLLHHQLLQWHLA
jgi:hypothetical protein